MALKETIVTKAADKAVTPLDWGKDKVTEGFEVKGATVPGTDALSDALYNRLEESTSLSETWKKRIAESPVGAVKALARMGAVAASALTIYKATGELPTHDAAALMADSVGYAPLVATTIGGSIIGKERGEKIQVTSSEFVLQSYEDPSNLPGFVYNGHTGEVIDRSTASESYRFKVLPDMGVLYNPSTGEIDEDSWFDPSTGEIYDKDGNVDTEYSVNSDGRIVGPNFIPLKANENIAPVLDYVTNEYNTRRVVDLDTGIVFGIGANALDPSNPASGVYDPATKLIKRTVDGKDQYLDVADGLAIYKDEDKEKSEVERQPVGVHTGKDARGNDAIDIETKRKTTRDQDTKKRWSGSTTHGERALDVSPTNTLVQNTKGVLKDTLLKAPLDVSRDKSSVVQEIVGATTEAKMVYKSFRLRRKAKLLKKSLKSEAAAKRNFERSERQLGLKTEIRAGERGYSSKTGHKSAKRTRRLLDDSAGSEDTQLAQQEKQTEKITPSLGKKLDKLNETRRKRGLPEITESELASRI